MTSPFGGLDDDPSDRRFREVRSSRTRRIAILQAVGSIAVLLIAMGIGAVVGEQFYGEKKQIGQRMLGAIAAGGLLSFVLMAAFVFRAAPKAAFSAALGSRSDEKWLGWKIWGSAAVGAFIGGPLGAQEGLPPVDDRIPEVYFGSLIAGLIALVGISVFRIVRK